MGMIISQATDQPDVSILKETERVLRCNL